MKISFFRSLLPSIIFNFKHLPFGQALHMPILLNKPHLREFSGTIRIEAEKISRGMIQLGFPLAGIFADNGITIKHNGELVFRGKCKIGSDSYIVTGKSGAIVFGDDFMATGGAKLVSMCGILFGEHCRLGWYSIVIDTNFHPVYDLEKKHFKKAFGKVNIGDNNWFGMQCLIMPSVTTPERCIFGARSIVTRGAQYESNCIHGGNPVRVLTRNVVRIIGQDQIHDYSEQ